jgi:hypothetical protein
VKGGLILAEKEIYRAQIAVEVTGDEPAKVRLKAMQKYIEHTEKRTKALGKVKVSSTANLVDKVTGKLRAIKSALGKLAPVKTITVQILDKASGTIKSIISKLTSPLALLGAGGGFFGLGKLTLGSAAVWETQAVSMEHWLKGNKKLAQETTAWLDKLADATPFEMEDLFPAMTRAIGIYDGNVKKAQRLTKLATDMAGLTPGKTVRDAMEAMADAQMGEFERLKEFQMKMTKEQMKSLGGFDGFLAVMERKFAGGAQKLSETAIGRVSTITDNIKKLFRSAGTGMLDGMQPGLKKITEGFTKNEAGLKRLHERFNAMGRSIGAAVVSKLEQASRWIDKITSDKTFQKLSLGDKFIYILDKGLDEVSKWLDGPGGKKMQAVFIKLGGIAAKAWVHTLTGSIKASGSSLMSGDFLGALLGAGAFLKLGGGKLFTGGFKLAKSGYKLLKGAKAAKTAANVVQNTANVSKMTTLAETATTGAKFLYGPNGQVLKTITPLAETAITGTKGLVGPSGQLLKTITPAAETVSTVASTASSGAKFLGTVSKVGKVAGKFALPVQIGAEVLDVATSKDKVKAASKSAAGLAGMWGGAKLGALIGTAIAPGIGTAIGAALGGAGGYFIGQWMANKTVDAIRDNKNKKLSAEASQMNYQNTTGQTDQQTTLPNQVNQQIDVQVVINQNGAIDSDALADEVGQKVAVKLGSIFANSTVAFKSSWG